MSKITSDSLEALLQFFPVIDPPITVSEDIITDFSKENKPIPRELVFSVFSQWETFDEYTEIIPCFRLNTDEWGLHTFIYWKGALMTYEYILMTMDKKGHFINKKVIAGTISNGHTIKKSVATITEEFLIHSTVGETTSDDKYNPQNSKVYTLEILPDGTIDTSSENVVDY